MCGSGPVVGQPSLLDRFCNSGIPLYVQGYGITLGTINGLNVASSILQAIPNLQVQVVTIVTWMIARFFMYSRLEESLSRESRISRISDENDSTTQACLSANFHSCV